MANKMPRSVKVEKAFENLASAARWAGIDTNGLSFNSGSKSNGIAFRIYTVDPNGGGHGEWPYAPPGGYLGMTPAEAIKTLDTMRYVFYGFANVKAQREYDAWKEGA
jgi:hypothetical protein